MAFNPKKRKIITITYACNPYRGSEHGVGWGWIKMIAESHEIHVIAAQFEKVDIDHWLEQHPEYKSRMRFYFPRHRPWHYHKQSKAWVRIENSPLKIIMNMAYRLWQGDAFRLAERLHQQHHFDLCHLITYVGFRFPGRFYQLDCPFIWGPIGGLENTPRHFLPLLGTYGAVYFTVRNLINDVDRRILPGPRKAMQKAAQYKGIIAATSGIQREIRRWYGMDSTVICEIGPPAINILLSHPVRNDREPFRLCWSGEHLPRKALQLLLMALSELPLKTEWLLDILGDGPCRRKWQKMADKSGILQRCVFHGRLTRDKSLEVMKNAHIFVITSLQDLTSTVLLESLSLGVPVIAPDHCGFSDVLNEKCGIKIKIKDLDNFIHQLALHIQTLYQDEPLRRRLAQGALDRVNVLSWGKKRLLLEEIYQQAVHTNCKF